MREQARERVLILDFVRVAAIFMVLFSHLSITIGPPWSETVQPYFGVKGFYWATWGELGVTLFLVISGFSLEYAYGRRPLGLNDFYKRRLIRIYPIYYLSLLVGLGMALAISAWATLRHGHEFVFLPGFTLWDFFLALTGFNAFAGKWGGPLVWSSWFIGLIVSLYLFFPFVSAVVRRFPWASLLGLFLISVVFRVLTGQTAILPGGALEWFPLNRLFEFGLGIFLARKLTEGILLRFNRGLRHVPFLVSLSALSFPLFLIHDPLRRFIYFGPPENPASLIIGIPVFLFLSVFLSQVALFMDRRLAEVLLKRVSAPAAGTVHGVYGRPWKGPI